MTAHLTGLRVSAFGAGSVITGRTPREPDEGAKRPVAGFLAHKPDAAPQG